MALPKGFPKPATSGRKKGTPNKNREDLLEICRVKGVDPFTALIELYQSCEKPEVQLGALKELAGYLYPKLKALEISGTNPFAEKTTEELEKIVLERLKKKHK